MLEAVEAALDPVTVFVDVAVMRDADLAVALRRDHRRGFHGGDLVAQIVAVIALVGQHGLGPLAFEQVGRT